MVRSLTQRDSLDLRNQPLKEKEDDSSKGCETCYFGSRSSDRYLRLYNKRGPNRLEAEYKQRRASIVADDLFKNLQKIDDFYNIAISHLRDFIDVDLPWWWEFVNDIDRAYAKIHSAKEVSLEKSKDWLLNQAAPTIAAINHIDGGNFLMELIIEGRPRMYKNCSNLLELHGKGARYEHQ